MADHPLLDVPSVDALEPYLRRVGDVFRAFRTQDSGCVSYGVTVDGERWFVKSATSSATVASVRSAVRLHAAVYCPAIIPPHHTIALDDGLALVSPPWADGEVLYHPTTTHRGGRTARDSAYTRFRRLPVTDILGVVDRILDAHLAVERAGFVAVDFYDGCLLYGFERASMSLCALDE